MQASAYSQRTFASKPEWSTNSWFVGYYGDYVTNPGVQVAWEHAFLNHVKSKSRTKRGLNVLKYKTNRLELRPSFSAYIDGASHSGLVPNLSLQYKRINHHRMLFNLGIGMGIWNAILSNVYDLQGQDITGPTIQVRSYPAPSFHLNIGRVKEKESKIQGWDLGITSQFLWNYNATIQPVPALTFGYRF